MTIDDSEASAVTFYDPNIPLSDTPFVLDLFSSSFGWGIAGDMPVETGPVPEGMKYLMTEMTWLRIRSDVSGSVTPMGTPGDDDVTGFVPPAFEREGLAVRVVAPELFPGPSSEAVGLFHARVNARELEEIRRVVERTRWAQLPRPVGYDFEHPEHILEFRYSSGGLLIERGFNSDCVDFLDASGPVWDLLGKLERATRPTATIEAHVRLEPAPDDPLRYTIYLSLENRARQSVVLTDPHLPVDEGPPRIEVKVGAMEAEQLLPPRDWLVLPVPPLPEGAPRTVVLPAKGRFEIALTWTAPGPGLYRLGARWYDYGGPVKPVKRQLPFMPLPEQGPSLLGPGPYPVRGSTHVDKRFEVPAEAPKK